MSDPREIENGMVVDDEQIYEKGIDFWMRGHHRKVDPDYRGEEGLHYPDDKPAYEKNMAE